MRRLDRDFSNDEAVIEACIKESQVIRLALSSAPVPYIVPLCFGYEKEGEKRVFYFHKAKAGRLNDLIGRGCTCAFELEGEASLYMDDEKRTCSMNYCSIIGEARVVLVEDEGERSKGIRLLMEHYNRGDYPVEMRAMPAVSIYRVEVMSFTAKATRAWRDMKTC